MSKDFKNFHQIKSMNPYMSVSFHIHKWHGLGFKIVSFSLFWNPSNCLLPFHGILHLTVNFPIRAWLNISLFLALQKIVHFFITHVFTKTLFGKAYSPAHHCRGRIAYRQQTTIKPDISQNHTSTSCIIGSPASTKPESGLDRHPNHSTHHNEKHRQRTVRRNPQ